MINLTDIHSLTDFNRNSKQHLQRLKETGRPEVLTVKGQAEIVVQSAVAYQQLLEAITIAEHLPTLRNSLAQAIAGEGRPMRDVIQGLAAEAGFSTGK